MKREDKREFTLIELLIVIAIIALLVALLFPALAAARNAAKKVQAKSMANNIVIAVKQYKTTYGLLPGWDTGDSHKDLTGTTDFEWDDVLDSSNDDAKKYDILMQILTKVDMDASASDVDGKSSLANARNIHFVEAPSHYAEKGYVDPWGHRFIVLMDRNFDQKIEKSKTGGDIDDMNGLVAVYSCGPNGKDDDGSEDDIVTWQE